ncbi:MAG TPA: diaminopimelate decarboxylase [Stellaceae bacterium]|nr:diaminopimelate decarboxylase [Stellaceae bacterium]
MPKTAPWAPEFAYRDGALCVEAMPLAAIADAVGTPCYVYSRAQIARRYREFAGGFGAIRPSICYSVKANPNLAVIALLGQLGAGADVVSEGEFRRALAAGIPGSRIIFSGVGKTARELEFALAHDVHQINVESLPELEALSAVAQRMKRVASIAIRINPDVDARTHAKITTGKKENKFGIDLAHASAAYKHAQGLPGLRAVGIAVHIGSQLTSLRPFEIAFRRIAELYRQLRADGVPLDRLDCGGGLGIRYADEAPPAIADYGAMVARIAGNLGAALSVEPGRAIVGNAGVLMAQVIYVKQGVTRRFVVLDAAMNDLIRPALYDAWHEILPLRGPPARRGMRETDVVGPVCETGDTFAAKRKLPPLAAGDRVALMSAGAYGASMSSGYNTRLPAPEVLVDGAHFAVIRPRPSYEAVLGEDRLPPWLTRS